jgi:hypothetical protein
MAVSDSGSSPPAEAKGFWAQLWSSFFLLAGVGSLMLAVGTVYMVAVLSAPAFDQAFRNLGSNTDLLDWRFGLALGVTVIGLILAVYAFIIRSPQSNDDLEQYDYALVGLGFTLALVGLLNFVALSGFAFYGHLDEILIYDEAITCRPTPIRKIKPTADSKLSPAQKQIQTGNQSPDRNSASTDRPTGSSQQIAQDNCQVYQMVRLALMPGFAILGSLFFIAGSMRQKRDALEKQLWIKNQPTSVVAPPKSPDETDKDLRYRGIKFWGGLWYRMGEAILFALVVYLVLKTMSAVDASDALRDQTNTNSHNASVSASTNPGSSTNPNPTAATSGNTAAAGSVKMVIAALNDSGTATTPSPATAIAGKPADPAGDKAPKNKDDKQHPKKGFNLLWLLALSLVIGMFVKPAEVLINGIGQRLFGAVKELTKS